MASTAVLLLASVMGIDPSLADAAAAQQQFQLPFVGLSLCVPAAASSASSETV